MLTDSIIRDFILNEGTIPSATLGSYLQTLTDIINSIKPKLRADEKRLEHAKELLFKMRKMIRQLEEQNNSFKEQLSEITKET